MGKRMLGNVIRGRYGEFMFSDGLKGQMEAVILCG